MSALHTFDRELSQHNEDGKDSWYDSGIAFVGQLAADLASEDVIALRDLWPNRPIPWQQHCAEVLGRARHLETVPLLVDMVQRATPDVSLAALETLRDFDPALLSEDQRELVLKAVNEMQARPVGTLHHLVLGAFMAKLRADEGDTH